MGLGVALGLLYRPCGRLGEDACVLVLRAFWREREGGVAGRDVATRSAPTGFAAAVRLLPPCHGEGCAAALVERERGSRCASASS
mmetsp:Transcript_43885/g.123986  ORF Transcript_43885/g.123986 Transcript_43885/m.123986 type:complete len:85 (-) Transcript_43885:64-318(-)